MSITINSVKIDKIVKYINGNPRSRPHHDYSCDLPILGRNNPKYMTRIPNIQSRPIVLYQFLDHNVHFGTQHLRHCIPIDDKSHFHHLCQKHHHILFPSRMMGDGFLHDLYLQNLFLLILHHTMSLKY